MHSSSLALLLFSPSLHSPPALVFVARGFGVQRSWCGGKGFVLLPHWGLTCHFLMGFTAASGEQNRPGVAQLKECSGRVNIVHPVSPTRLPLVLPEILVAPTESAHSRGPMRTEVNTTLMSAPSPPRIPLSVFL